MKVNKDIFIRFFLYLWISAAVFVILFILSQAFYTKRTLEHYLDFSESVSQDINGWYPTQRLSNISVSSIANAYDVIAEPVYMKIYTPIDFEIMNIAGSIQPHKLEDIKLGLKQEDNSWDYQQIVNNDFDLNFDLAEAQVINNQLEIILSIPGLNNPDRVSLINNWQIKLSR
jgi:hypothetical protein